MTNQQETQALSQENLTPLNEEQLQNATGGGGCFGKLLPSPRPKNASDGLDKRFRKEAKEIIRKAKREGESVPCQIHMEIAQRIKYEESERRLSEFGLASSKVKL